MVLYYLSSRYTTTNDLKPRGDLVLANAEDIKPEKHGVLIFLRLLIREVLIIQTRLYIYGDDTVVREKPLKRTMDIEEKHIRLY